MISTLLTSCLLGVAFAQTVPSTPQKCYDQTNPFDFNSRVAVDCLSGARLGARAVTAVANAPTPTSASAAPPLPSSSQGIVSGFDFSSFNCSVVGVREDDFCEGAKAAFENAGSILSQIFKINTVIKVNTSIRPFCPNGVCYCTAGGDCDGPTHLGAAAPARFIPLRDSDGEIRYYPQALVKQMGLPGVAFQDSDINAMFNGNTSFLTPPQQYWLPGDNLPLMSDDISDFESTVLHELLHGMGFMSAWSYRPATGTDPALFLPTFDQDVNSTMFTVFDRFLVQSKDNSSLVPPGLQLSKIMNGTEGNSSTLVALAAPLGELGTIPNSITFTSVAGTRNTLETALNPWRPGSSGSHLDYESYSNTSDFLMTWQDVQGGGNLAQQIAVRNGLLNGDQLNDNNFVSKIDLRLALGNGTRAIMESLGWQMRTDEDADAPAPTSAVASLPSDDTPFITETIERAKRTQLARKVVQF